MMFKNKNLLITGGTGSLGKALTKHFLKHYTNINKIIIYSRDEQKQYQMAQEYPNKEYPQIRFFIGDVRDSDRLFRALENVDYVIHAAAMKHVPIAEYNPDECIKTNILGAQNVINNCLLRNVSSVVSLSTDKACAPINLYGATKLTSDKLFIAANNITGNKNIKFSVVRYGNVMGSNGSVIPLFLKKKSSGVFPITHKEMTRFNITIDLGVEMIIYALKNSWGGEMFVPKIPSYNILDVAKAIDSKAKLSFVGVRPGEKLHEEMISESDSYNTYDLGSYYVVLPNKTEWSLNKFVKTFNAKRVKEGFNYNSKDNDKWETVQSLKILISKYVI